VPLTITDPYIEFGEYAERNQVHSDAEAVVIEQILVAVSRHMDKKLGNTPERPRHFYQDTDTRYFSGTGIGRLWVDDFVSITSIGVDEDRDGVYETTFDLTDIWCVGWPYNAASHNRPFTRLDLISRGSPTLTIWPDFPMNVEVQAVFGWPEVPPEIKEAVAVITRHLRDLEESGITLNLGGLDSSIAMSPGATTRMREIEAQFSRREFGIA